MVSSLVHPLFEPNEALKVKFWSGVKLSLFNLKCHGIRYFSTYKISNPELDLSNSPTHSRYTSNGCLRVFRQYRKNLKMYHGCNEPRVSRRSTQYVPQCSLIRYDCSAGLVLAGLSMNKLACPHPSVLHSCCKDPHCYTTQKLILGE
jgi:hypothetical protein